MSKSEKSPQLTHLDEQGRARMVDVGGKAESRRLAVARGVVRLGVELMQRLLDGRLPKGEALGVARVAGIQAAKETPRLIPLCHPLALSRVEIRFEPLGEDSIEVQAEVACTGPTGVEMEALTAVSVACLTIYDMCKAVEKGIRIGPIELCAKSGGKSGDWRRQQTGGE